MRYASALCEEEIAGQDFEFADLRLLFAFFYALIDCPESRVIRLVK